MTRQRNILNFPPFYRYVYKKIKIRDIYMRATAIIIIEKRIIYIEEKDLVSKTNDA